MKDSDQAFIEISPSYDDIEIVFDESQHTQLRHSATYNGFKKYWVNYSDDNDVYFSVVNKKQRNTNYMMRYFFTGLGGENEFLIDLNPEIHYDILQSNDNLVDVSLKFKGIQIFERKKLLKEDNVYFTIYGNLFHDEQNLDEYINTTCILSEQKSMYGTQVKHNYNYNNFEDWTLIFNNIERKNHFIYDLQLLINVIYENKIFDEEFLTYKTTIDLREIEKKEEESHTALILGVVFGSIGAVLIIFFVIKYIRLQKRNAILKEDLKSLAYSSDIQKNVLVKDKKNKSDTDYDTTFI